MARKSSRAKKPNKKYIDTDYDDDECGENKKKPLKESKGQQIDDDDNEYEEIIEETQEEVNDEDIEYDNSVSEEVTIHENILVQNSDYDQAISNQVTDVSHYAQHVIDTYVESDNQHSQEIGQEISAVIDSSGIIYTTTIQTNDSQSHQQNVDHQHSVDDQQIDDQQIDEQQIDDQQIDEQQQETLTQSHELSQLPQMGLAPDLVIAEAIEILITMYQCKFCTKRFDTIDKVKAHYLKRHFGQTLGTSGYALKLNDKHDESDCHESEYNTTNNNNNNNLSDDKPVRQARHKGLSGNLQLKLIPSHPTAEHKHQQQLIAKRRGRPRKFDDKPVRYKEPPRQYKCPFEGCKYIAKYRSNLWDHKKTHTGEKPYGCSWPGCTSRFSQAQQLKLHLRSHTGEKPFACEWPGCQMRFTQKPGLKAHMRTHTGEKPFACDWPGCEWRFRLKGALTDHKRAVHENSKSYICEWPGCNKKFLQSCHLKKHMMSHADIKPYSCDWPGCEYRAVTQAYVANHRKSHTGEKNFECKFPGCNKKFTKSSHVVRHQQRFHANQTTSTTLYEIVTSNDNVDTTQEYQ